MCSLTDKVKELEELLHHNQKALAVITRLMYPSSIGDFKISIRDNELNLAGPPLQAFCDREESDRTTNIYIKTLEREDE